MPPNLYGVSNAPTRSVTLLPSGDIVIPGTSTWTTVYSTSAIVAPSQGFFYPVIMGFFQMLWSATAPTAIYSGFSIGAGSVVDTNQYDGVFYGAGASYYRDQIFLVGTPSETTWRAPGSVINIQFNSNQSCTCRGFQFRCVITLMRAPDQ